MGAVPPNGLSRSYARSPAGLPDEFPEAGLGRRARSGDPDRRATPRLQGTARRALGERTGAPARRGPSASLALPTADEIRTDAPLSSSPGRRLQWTPGSRCGREDSVSLPIDLGLRLPGAATAPDLHGGRARRGRVLLVDDEQTILGGYARDGALELRVSGEGHGVAEPPPAHLRAVRAGRRRAGGPASRRPGDGTRLLQPDGRGARWADPGRGQSPQRQRLLRQPPPRREAAGPPFPFRGS